MCATTWSRRRLSDTMRSRFMAWKRPSAAVMSSKRAATRSASARPVRPTRTSKSPCATCAAASARRSIGALRRSARRSDTSTPISTVDPPSRAHGDGEAVGLALDARAALHHGAVVVVVVVERGRAQAFETAHHFGRERGSMRAGRRDAGVIVHGLPHRAFEFGQRGFGAVEGCMIGIARVAQRTALRDQRRGLARESGQQLQRARIVFAQPAREQQLLRAGQCAQARAQIDGGEVLHHHGAAGGFQPQHRDQAQPQPERRQREHRAVAEDEPGSEPHGNPWWRDR